MSEEGLDADLFWIQFFRSIVTSGDLARLSGSAIKIYLALKCRGHLGTGQAVIRHERLGIECGLSVATVKRGLGELCAAGYLNRCARPGQRNAYSLVEQFPISRGGEIVGTARFGYVGKTAQSRREELNQLLSSGKLGADNTTGIQVVINNNLFVEHLNLNLNVTTGGYPDSRTRQVLEDNTRRARERADYDDN
jgi:hypothetical protein